MLSSSVARTGALLHLSLVCISGFITSALTTTVALTSMSASTAAHAERLVLEPVTITASRWLRPLSTVPASVTVLDGAALQPFAGTALEDILATAAGVSLARSGGPGQQTSVFLRGTNSDSVLVLVDGVKFNGGAFGGASLQNLRGADIARIEVVRGPRSALYGSEAIGGVISITTRRAEATAADQAIDTLSLRAERGSDRSGELRASASHDAGADHFALAIGDFRTDGDPATDRTTITGEHRNTSGTLSAASQRGNTRYGFDGWAAAGSSRYVDCVYDLMYNCIGTIPLNQDFHNSVAALWSETLVSEQLRVKTRLGYADDQLDQRDSSDFAGTERFTGALEAEWRPQQHTVIAGLEHEREDVAALIYGGPVQSRQNISALFLHDDLIVGRHQFGAGLRTTDYDSFGRQATGEASYGLRLGAQGFTWLAWGRGFRAPDASERFGFGGNPLLAPEKSDSVEAGLRWRVGRQVFTGTGFVQKIEDLIDYPAPTYTAVNIAEARITGTELGWSWQGTDSHVDLFVTLQDPVDAGSGQRLARRPEQQLTASAQHRLGPLQLRASVLAMSARDNSAFDTVRLPGFAVVNVGAAWTVQPGLVLDARIENVGDIAYALASGSAGDYLMPDRALFLAIEWRAESRYARH